MTELQIRVLKRMVDLVDAFDNDALPFPQLVSNLEALVDVGEFSGSFAEAWYDAWSPLEEAWDADPRTDSAIAASTKELKNLIQSAIRLTDPLPMIA